MAIYGSVRNRTPGMINRTVASLELKTQKKKMIIDTVIISSNELLNQIFVTTSIILYL